MAKKGGHWGDKGTKGDYISIYRYHDGVHQEHHQGLPGGDRKDKNDPCLGPSVHGERHLLTRCNCRPPNWVPEQVSMLPIGGSGASSHEQKGVFFVVVVVLQVAVEC